MSRIPQITPGPWKAKQLGTYNEPGWAVFYPDTTKPGVHMRRLDYRGCFTEADAQVLACGHELLDVVRQVVEWNQKYPSGRIFSHSEIIRIAGEMEVINQLAIVALAKATEVTA